jgi:UDP-GlcNAc3NAcA epimerase
MKIVTVVGARPQFIKATAVSHTIRERYNDQVEEVLLHTGQHYDKNMSTVFFDELDLPEPRYNLGISGGSHSVMTGRMMAGIEEVLIAERPDRLLVYGDTNSTLAAALAAVKLQVPVAHVEAGVRSFRLDMPEEVNRLVTDRVSSMLFCPTSTAVENLEREGIRQGVHQVGDVTCDLLIRFMEPARRHSTVLARFQLEPGGFVLATCHRAENTDNAERFLCILETLASIAEDIPVILPLHPRARKMAQLLNLPRLHNGLYLVDPQPFLDMIALEQAARVILTDSGGIQKEAFFFNVPCITLRDETEWVETVSLGANVLAGASREKILAAFTDSMRKKPATIRTQPFGNGRASEGIVEKLVG